MKPIMKRQTLEGWKPTGTLEQQMQRGLEACLERERHIRMPTVEYVSPQTFAEYVRLGLIDEHGNRLPSPGSGG